MTNYIAYDATQMGTQTAAALLRDRTTAKLVNMVEAAKKADVYSTIGKVVLRKLTTTSHPELKRYFLRHKDTMLNRSVWKRPTMTVLYGATVTTFRVQLSEDLTEITGERPCNKTASELATVTYAALKEVLPAPIALMGSLTGIVKAAVTATNLPFSFTTATNTTFEAAKYKEVGVRNPGAVFGFSKTSRITYIGDTIAPGPTAKSVAAQFIQSFDAVISKQIQRGCVDGGIPVLSVFDSWSVPAEHSAQLLEIARDAYINNLSFNYLQRFYDEALATYPFLSDEPELFLELGDYDISKELVAANMFIGL